MQRSILFVVPTAPDPENDAALRWLSGVPDVDVRPVQAGEIDTVLPRSQATVWYHWADHPEPTPAERDALDVHVRRGGGALLTLMAAGLPVRLGWEPVAPNEETRGRWTDEAGDLALAESFSVLPRVRGLQSFRGHPLFDGLGGGGAYTWAPRPEEPFTRCCYSGDVWPDRARVVAIERSYIAMDPGRRLAWEYMLEDGWVVCIGGSVHFAARSRLQRPHLERVTRNALDRASPDGGRARLLGGEWARPSVGLRLDRDVPTPAAPSRPFSAGSAHRPGRSDGPAGRRETGSRGASAPRPRLARPPADELYALAGERALLMGHEREGHREVWFHPFRAVSAWSFRSERLEPIEFAIEPGAVRRLLRLGDVELVERTTVSPEEPVVMVELLPARQGGGPAELIWTLETDLRLMWPYPPWAPGGLAYSVEGGSVGLRAATGEWLGIRIEPSPDVVSVANVSDAGRSRVRFSAELDARRPTRILLGGAVRDEEPPLSVSPGGSRARWEESTRSGYEGRLTLVCGDRRLEEALEWAKWRLVTYRVHVPGLGTSVVAGYNASRRDAFSDGRPGYAWFFGRDACWTALASLAAGQFDTAREVLEFLGRNQDITGKILHECTTSGIVHYDAADSTPLYLLLAARYLAWTGDVETLRREWPHIQHAYEYCLATDSDGDGLIENTDVGHGWVEFGPLGGNHVSLYLAGIWVAALAELQDAARDLGFEELAGQVAYRAAAARSALELSFYDPVLGRYAVGRRTDGSLNTTESVLTAVPLLLDSVRPDRCLQWLDRVASDDFTADWGVRMLPRSDPHYRPDGYHTGSVWPLFGGWVSLAEYRARRADAAFRHWVQVASHHTEFSLGAWPEVLHGEERRRIGVTPDQAWSTAMTVLPLVVGMLGARPAAVGRRLDLAPQIPDAWPSGAVGDLRVGNSRVSVRWDDGGGDGRVRVDVEGEPLEVRVSGPPR